MFKARCSKGIAPFLFDLYYLKEDKKICGAQDEQ
jgi:hypothetical protein